MLQAAVTRNSNGKLKCSSSHLLVPSGLASARNKCIYFIQESFEAQFLEGGYVGDSEPTCT